MGQKVTLATLNHGIAPENRHSLYPLPITIGCDVWIGAGATVVPSVTIVDNAVVGTDSVATKDIPPNTIVAGIPAKVISTL